jgi:tetratricopeptide (TPR) repeat protein
MPSFHFHQNVKIFWIAIACLPFLASAGDAERDAMGGDETRVEAGKFFAEPINPELLEKYNGEVREYPRKYKRRWQRCLLLLKHGESGAPTQEDIDTLLASPAWREQGERLQAIRWYLQGRIDEAKALIKKNILGNVNADEQSQLLASIELSRNDSDAAIAAYRMAWDAHANENVYINLLNIHNRRGGPPRELLEQGLRIYPRSPGPMQVIFEGYYKAGGRDNLLKCLALSDSAQKAWWPHSVDWKLRNAKVLLDLGKPEKAELVLQGALDLMENDERLRTNSETNSQIRKDIFALLERSRKTPPATGAK